MCSRRMWTAALLAAMSLGCSSRCPGMSAESKKRKAHAEVGECAFKRMGEPRPGDWLAIRDEPGQLLGEYVAALRNKKSAKRHTIYIQPLGEPDERLKAVLGKMREFAAVFFDCKTVLLPAAPAPQYAYAPERRQHNASRILHRLARRVPDDGLALVGVTSLDLYVPQLNFVFGLASYNRRVGVYSVARYGVEPDKLLRRSLKVMSHETGHILGLAHCIFYECGMAGSNSMPESDRRPIHFCPVCVKKLQHNLGFDAQKRYERLGEFYAKLGWDADAAFVRKLGGAGGK